MSAVIEDTWEVYMQASHLMRPARPTPCNADATRSSHRILYWLWPVATVQRVFDDPNDARWQERLEALAASGYVSLCWQGADVPPVESITATGVVTLATLYGRLAR